MKVEMPYLIVICVSCVGHGRRRDIVSVHSCDHDDGAKAVRHRDDAVSTKLKLGNVRKRR